MITNKKQRGPKGSSLSGAAVFNKQENRPDSRPLYFLIWRIFAQITQAVLVCVEVQITEGGGNCRRRGGHFLEREVRLIAQEVTVQPALL